MQKLPTLCRHWYVRDPFLSNDPAGPALLDQRNSQKSKDGWTVGRSDGQSSNEGMKGNVSFHNKPEGWSINLTD